MILILLHLLECGIFLLVIFATYAMSNKTFPLKVSSVLYTIYVLCFFFIKLEPPIANIYFFISAIIICITCFLSICWRIGGLFILLDYFFKDLAQENHLGFTKKGLAMVWTGNINHNRIIKQQNIIQPRWKSWYCGVILLFLFVVNVLLDPRMFFILLFALSRVETMTPFYPILGFLLLKVFGLVFLCYDPIWKANFEEIVGPKALHFLGYNTVTTKLVDTITTIGLGGVGLSSEDLNTSSEGVIATFDSEEKSREGIMNSPASSNNSTTGEKITFPFDKLSVENPQLQGAIDLNREIDVHIMRSIGRSVGRVVSDTAPDSLETLASSSALLTAIFGTELATNPDLRQAVRERLPELQTVTLGPFTVGPSESQGLARQSLQAQLDANDLNRQILEQSQEDRAQRERHHEEDRLQRERDFDLRERELAERERARERVEERTHELVAPHLRPKSWREKIRFWRR